MQFIPDVMGMHPASVKAKSLLSSACEGFHTPAVWDKSEWSHAGVGEGR